MGGWWSYESHGRGGRTTDWCVGVGQVGWVGAGEWRVGILGYTGQSRRGGGRGGRRASLGDQDHTHGVSVTGAWTPAGQDDDCVVGLEEASGFAHLHGEVDTHVDILGPDVVRGLVVEDGEDAAVEVALACRLVVTRHSDDGCAGAVPGDQLGRPAGRKR